MSWVNFFLERCRGDMLLCGSMADSLEANEPVEVTDPTPAQCLTFMRDRWGWNDEDEDDDEEDDDEEDDDDDDEDEDEPNPTRIH